MIVDFLSTYFYLQHSPKNLAQSTRFARSRVYSGGINSAGIESRPDIRQTAEVLRRLADLKLSEPAIATGWTRSLISGGSMTDIDVPYVGGAPYIEARTISLAT